MQAVIASSNTLNFPPQTHVYTAQQQVVQARGSVIIFVGGVFVLVLGYLLLRYCLMPASVRKARVPESTLDWVILAAREKGFRLGQDVPNTNQMYKRSNYLTDWGDLALGVQASTDGPTDLEPVIQLAHNQRQSRNSGYELDCQSRDSRPLSSPDVTKSLLNHGVLA